MRTAIVKIHFLARTFPVALLLLFLSIFFSGCSSGPDTAGLALVDPQGNHPDTFISTHPSLAVTDVDQCKSCHGSDLSGGIAKVSCFLADCHHGTIPTWADPSTHGAAAKGDPVDSGFPACRICHGADYSTRLGTPPLNCFDCHGVNAPHPAAPWRGSTGPTHTTTDPANAPVCATCHFPGSPNNPAGHPATPAPAGTPPGCFNNTLCHGPSSAPHILGTEWRDPAVGGANFHGLTAKQDLAFCQACHGTPGTIRFDGGSAPTSCSTSGCHPFARAHPVPWYQAPQSFPNYVASHRTSGNRDVACAICHDAIQGRTAPDPSAPSCFSASRNGIPCHVNGPGSPNHAVPFDNTDHTAVDQSGFDGDCSVCHSVTGTFPVSAAPPCTVCHQSGSPLTLANCTSCHAKPPSGSVYPDIANRHAKHNALAGVTDVCGACHAGLASGTLNHYNRANARPGMDALRTPPGDTAFDAAYDAKGGAASFSGAAFTCANVSCHGGITTPRWDTGTIASNTNAGCLACHTLGTALGTPENNSPYSGLHDFHLGTTVGALCTECHDMTNGTAGAQNHFAFLGTPQMEGPASQTVTFPGLAGATYDNGAQTCTLTCHGTVHSGFSWSGGANHSVPFTGTAHTHVSPSTFFSNCGACHFETGGTDKIGPTCTVCHQSGSPLSFGSCTSCHAAPPAGSAYPDIAGRHSGHVALDGPGTPVSCATCHNGLDTGTQAHYERANARPGMDALRSPPGDAAFGAAYNAKSGASSFNASAFTCANVSCHGGQTTPHWRTGTLNVNTQCASCHAFGTSQYNSYNSGRHDLHVTGEGFSCTVCHNTTSLAAGHFTALSTTAMEGPASATIGGGSTSIPAGNYNPSTGSCNPACHGTENW